MKLNNKGNWTLIGLLAAVAAVVVVGYFVFVKGGVGTVEKDSQLLDKESQKQTVVGKAIDTGKSVDCQERLRQIRSGIEMYRQSSSTGGNPPSLRDAVPGVSTAYFYCPVSNKAYVYDPATGTVRCPTHPQF